ncbi:MAG: hypothetical protein CMM87_01740 [Rickettsiales bacterium]|nr:hypothetical protein [Rickettsiales bacterium]|tara:strand:+ start:19039 stop:20256 length:1218 start_codon:yes stop_codon:yes gene_type:complete
MKFIFFTLIFFISFHLLLANGSDKNTEADDSPRVNPRARYVFSPLNPNHDNQINARRNRLVYQQRPPIYEGSKYQAVAPEKKKKTLREQALELRKLYLKNPTPDKRNDSGLLDVSASGNFKVLSPKPGQSFTLREALTEAHRDHKPASPPQVFDQSYQPKHTPRTRGKLFRTRSFHEREGATIPLANFPTSVAKVLSHEEGLLAALKEAITREKENFIANPSPSRLTRKKVSEMVLEKLKVSKKSGFSRVVMQRDRRLINCSKSLKKFVIQNDALIDPNFVDDKGRTNVERMHKGLAPIGPDGQSLQIHHLTQHDVDAHVELSNYAHCKAGRLQLHPKAGLGELGKSEVDRKAFNTFRADHWKARAAMYEWDEWEEGFIMKKDRPSYWTRSKAKRKKAMKRSHTS